MEFFGAWTLTAGLERSPHKIWRTSFQALRSLLVSLVTSHYVNWHCYIFVTPYVKMQPFCSGLNVLYAQVFSSLAHYTSAKWVPRYLNPLRAIFFRGNIKHIFIFHVIRLHWYGTGRWNSPSSKTRTCLLYIINIMAAGVLATQGARTSAAMILT